MTRSAPLATGGRVAVDITGTEDDERLTERCLAAALREIEGLRNKKVEVVNPHPVIIGRSPPMMALFKLLERIRQSDATVLVLGENGTGKELVAKAIHQGSRRHNKQFVATNCSAFNDNLLESELFGHRRGAFTGAVGDKPGLFEVADGGTFFMDEVGDMSPTLQVKLLRVIQEGTFMPVGGTETRKVDVRIIAATNRDLATMVKQGTFREDLYYRLHVVVLRVPPLRDRKDPETAASDVSVLVDHFLARLAKREKREKALTRRALDRLIAHEWPGNVRELENEMERLWVLSGDDNILDEELLSHSIGRRKVLQRTLEAALIHNAPGLSEPEPRVNTAPPPPPVTPPPSPATAVAPAGEMPVLDPGLNMPDAVEKLERHMISEELKKARGNKTKAADALGISRRNLIRKVQAYALDEIGRRRGET